MDLVSSQMATHMLDIFLLISVILTGTEATANTSDNRRNLQNCSIGVLNCPHQCTCCTSETSGDVIVMCSDKNLTSIPANIPSDTTILDLQGNHINVVTAEPLNDLLQLNVLDLSNNFIHVFNGGCFDKLTNLTSLDLQNNALDFNYKTYWPGLFKNLTNLQQLKIKDNLIPDPTNSENLLDETFGDLVSLQVFVMDDVLLNKKYKFGPRYKKLMNLKTIMVSISTMWCPQNGTYLSGETFVNVETVENLYINHCDIRHISGDSFVHFRNLHILDVRYNHFNMYILLNALQAITLPVFDTVLLSGNNNKQGLIINSDCAKFFFHSSIQTVDLKNERLLIIDSLPMSARYPGGNLRNVSVAQNYLTHGSYLSQLHFLVNLLAINASHQIMRKANKSNRSFNIGKTSRSLEACEPWVFTLPPNLRIIDLKSSGLTDCIPEVNLTISKLQYIDMSENHLVIWQGPIKGAFHLQHLDLSGNYCNFVNNRFFNEMIYLRTLILQNNNLGNVLSFDENGEIFGNLKHLLHLDLSRNNVHQLPKRVFRGMPMLKDLHLKTNFLRTLDGQLNALHQLHYVDLSTNHLFEIPESTQKSLQTISEKHAVILDIQENNLDCTCSNKDMFFWWQTTMVTIIISQTDDCNLPNGTSFHLNQTRAIANYLRHHCQSYMGLIIGCSISIVLFSVFILLAIVYRHRWKLRYLYYMTKMKYRGYSGFTNNEGNFIYDAFISYADEQLRFVKSQVIENLENIRGLSLCIHSRDFVPGITIASNITDAVHNSRKTIIVFSKAFLNSHWCKYELNIALAESNHTGRATLIFVIMENIPHKMIPLQILHQFQCFTYLKYPSNDDNMLGFWKTLERAIHGNEE